MTTNHDIDQQHAAFEAWYAQYMINGIDNNDGLFEPDVVEVARAAWQAASERVTASEAIYAFAAWLTTRKETVTLGSAHDAAIAAEVVSVFVKGQGWEPPRDDCTIRLHAYPVEFPTPPADGQEQQDANPACRRCSDVGTIMCLSDNSPDAEYIEIECPDCDALHGQSAPTSCQGRNCGATDGQEHSPECIIDAAEAQGWSDSPEAIRAYNAATKAEVNKGMVQ